MDTFEQAAPGTPESTDPAVRVYDIPATASAAETASIIEGHSGEYYMLAVVPWPGVGVRVFMRKHASLKASQTAKVKPTPVDKEAEAVDAIIRRNPKCPPGKLADKLAEHGLVRHPVWVASRRKNLDRVATAEKARKGA